MHEIASTRVRYGFWRIYVLIPCDCWHVNHKRIYQVSELQLWTFTFCYQKWILKDQPSSRLFLLSRLLKDA